MHRRIEYNEYLAVDKLRLLPTTSVVRVVQSDVCVCVSSLQLSNKMTFDLHIIWHVGSSSLIGTDPVGARGSGPPQNLVVGSSMTLTPTKISLK